MGLLKSCNILLLPFSIWILLSTVLPNFSKNSIYPSNLINKDGYLHTGYYNQLNLPTILKNNFTNSHIVLLTAHPDDESMFFTPTITELTKENYNNYFHLICLSNGDYNGLGNIRRNEIEKASKLLSIESVKVLDYVDDINLFWNIPDIVQTLETELKLLKKAYNIENKDLILLTFDENGVSNHPNHKSLYLAIKEYHKLSNIRSYSLKSWNIFIKYSGVLFTNIELTLKWLSINDSIKSYLKQHHINLFEYLSSNESSSSVKIYSDLNNLCLNFTTMTWAHYSQIVWFRWIWILFSKYMNSNELFPIS
jgi:N-acetylglucosaminylphosphatidylinositol deacetylase